MLQQLSIFFGRTIAIVARQKRGWHEGILRKHTAELTWHTFCWLFAWAYEKGKENLVDLLPNLHNHPYMCQEEVQRQKCVVLSFCLIIVKYKWRIERKYYFIRPVSPPAFIILCNKPARRHPPSHSNKKHISQKSPSTKKREKFSTHFPSTFSTYTSPLPLLHSAKNENHLSLSSLFRLVHIAPTPPDRI